VKHDSSRIMELERENDQLKRLLTAAELEKEKLRELATTRK
jgi:hypothetical protein